MQTFVVRIWTPCPKPSEPELERLCGVVEDLGSGRSTTFRDDDELLAFLRGQQRASTPGGVVRRPAASPE